ncbi:MAG TPA: hypothetical protein VHB21_20520 [Minicystis sp.]|nr:hypothetical protein [Minicystis sp.]
MTSTSPSSTPAAVDATEAIVWRGIVELLLAQGDTIADAMTLADDLVRKRRATAKPKPAARAAARSGVRPRVSSAPPAIPVQPSKLPTARARRS